MLACTLVGWYSEQHLIFTPLKLSSVNIFCWCGKKYSTMHTIMHVDKNWNGELFDENVHIYSS